MNLRNCYAPLLLLVVLVSLNMISLVRCKPVSPNAALLSALDAELKVDADGHDKRAERYALVAANDNGNKRLPVYNFGLGKRGKPYSFGLGKRGDEDEYVYYMDSLLLNDNDIPIEDDKRDRSGRRDRFGFGLGRR